MVLRALSNSTDRLGSPTTPLRSLLKCLTTLPVRKCFLMTSLYFSGYGFEPFPCTLPSGTKERRSAPPSPLLLLRKLYRATRSPLSLLFSEVDKPRVLSHSPQAIPSSPFTSTVAFLWMHSKTLTSLNCKPQNCTQFST